MLNKLGEGGFGTVLLVRKKDSGKLYALKVRAYDEGTLGSLATVAHSRIRFPRTYGFLPAR